MFGSSQPPKCCSQPAGTPRPTAARPPPHSHLQHDPVEQDAVRQLHVHAELVLAAAPQRSEGFHLPGNEGRRLVAGAGASPNPAAGGGPAPPAPSRGPRDTHPGHQGALQEELQQFRDGHVHVAGAGRAARRRGGSLGRQRRRAHGSTARQLPPTAATPRGPSPSGPRGRTGAAPPPPEPTPGRRPPPRGAARARDRRGQRTAPWEAERPPAGRPSRGGAAARSPRRYRSRTHAVHQRCSAQPAPSRTASSAPAALPVAGRALAPAIRAGPRPRRDGRHPRPMGAAERPARTNGRSARAGGGETARGCGRCSASGAAASVPPRRAPLRTCAFRGSTPPRGSDASAAASLSTGSPAPGHVASLRSTAPGRERAVQAPLLLV